MGGAGMSDALNNILNKTRWLALAPGGEGDPV